MKQEINLWNIIDKYPQSDINHPNHLDGRGDTIISLEDVYNIGKEIFELALNLAAENATVDYDCKEVFGVNKDSILQIKDWITS